MSKAYYASSISDFLVSSTESIQGSILIKDEFRATVEQRNSWRDEIIILKDQLSKLGREGSIIFEYTVPRIGMEGNPVGQSFDSVFGGEGFMDMGDGHGSYGFMDEEILMGRNAWLNEDPFSKEDEPGMPGLDD